MARLGEHLIAAGLVEADKVDQALRAQVVWGGRLGTNLIELGAIELDDLSRALGQQHGVPAALTRHFEKADPALQAELPEPLARQFGVVPLVRLSPERVAVVALDPLSATALAALAAVYRVNPNDGIVVSVAAEMRVLYHLERVYKIQRPTRYLRSRGTTITPFPTFDASFADEAGSEPEIVEPLTPIEPVAALPPHAQQDDADEIAALLDQAIENAIAHVTEGEPTGRERRTYVRTLADEASGPVPSSTAGALGRIAIRRRAVSASELAGLERASDGGGPRNLTEATRAIRRGPNRDRVAELVIETLERFVPGCEAALLLVIRGGLAIGWKHFVRPGKDSPPDLAVPLDQPGMLPNVIERKQTSRCGIGDLGSIDRRLLAALGREEGDLVVAPITIGQQVMCLVVAATETSSDVAPVEAVAASAGAAFARLIRDASR